MTREEVFEKVQEIVRDIFDEDDFLVTEETSSDEIEDWDSLNHLNLMSAISDEFEYKFTLAEMAKLYTVGSIVDKLVGLKK